MKILHLFSNWKWTGPAEPAINLCGALAARYDLMLIHGSPPDASYGNAVHEQANARGITTIPGFRLNKHLNLWHDVADARKLRKLISERKPDLIHTHLPNDHVVAGMACMANAKAPLIVRSFYGASGPETGLRSSLWLSRFTSGAIVITQAGRERLTRRYRFQEERSAVIPVGVDTVRFDPARIDRADARSALGLTPDDVVFGIVARMQRHRKFEKLLEAMRLAMAEDPRIKLIIVGRGTHREEVAIRPVREMGLEDHILFPGYISGDLFVEALSAMDAALFLVPGSDGSCRAVREKIVMGLPVIAAKTPPLDEMIVHGETGLLVELTVEGLKHAIMQMALDGGRLARMRKNALKYGRKHFALKNQAEAVASFYDQIMALS